MTNEVTDNPEGFGARLREERKRLGLSMEALAKAGGISRASQSNYETERNRPDSNYLAAIAALGIDVLYLLTAQRARAAEGFDWRAHDRILAAIERKIAGEAIALPFEKKMTLLRIAMKHLDAGEATAEDGVADLLRLLT